MSKDSAIAGAIAPSASTRAFIRPALTWAFARRTLAWAFALWALSWFSPASPAFSAASQWQQGEHVQARLIVATDSVGADGMLTFGIHLQLEEEWETYWRSPGDYGIPPKFDWSGAENLGEVSVAWPAPKRFNILGMSTFGYVGELVLPLSANIADPARPVTIRLHLVYAVCRDVCFLVEQDFALDLAPGPGWEDPEMAALIEKFQSAVPGGNAPDFAVERVSISGGGNPSIEILARATDPFLAPDVIIEAPVGFNFQAPTVRMIAGGRRVILRARFQQTPEALGPLEGNMVTITVIDGDRAVEQALPAQAAD